MAMAAIVRMTAGTAMTAMAVCLTWLSGAAFARKSK